MPTLPSRRGLLAGGATTVALAACDEAARHAEPPPAPAPVRTPEPGPWEAPGEVDDEAFGRGVQVGDTTDAAAIVSLRTSEASVSLVLVRAIADTGWEEVLREDVTIQDGGAQVDLSGLTADTPYTVCAYASDGARRTRPSRFRTAPAAGTARTVTFGATSCMKGNQPWPNLSFAAAEAFDLFLLLGDTVYADGAVTQAEYRAFWTAAMGTTGLQDLFASTSVIATWDDHEVGNDWSIDDEGMEEQATTALAAFKEAIPVGDGGGWAGIWRSLRWGDTLEVFVLECRAERRDGLYVSAEQLAWLERALLASTARFKLIANSVPITDFADTSLGDYFTEQRWQGHAEQRSEILSFILDNQIGGVLWLAGDFHFGLLARIDASGGPGEDAWEVLAGPSGSFLNPIVETLDDVDRFPVAFGAWNYTKFVADPGLGTIDVQWIGDDGTVIAERTLEV